MSTEERWLEAWQQRQRLLRIARKRVPTREDAEDVVAEAIQRAGAQDDLPVTAVAAWVTRVTINLCVDRQRRLATQRAALHRAELRPEPLPTHEDEVLARAEAAWLAAKVEDLPLRQALAVRLRADGIGNAEIASLLNVSHASVDGLLKRSRAALREALRAAGAVVVGTWAAASHSRRHAAVLVATAAVLVAVLPWTSSPHPPQAPRPADTPDLFVLEPPGVANTSAGDVAASATTAPTNDAVSRAASAPAGLGHALPYDGPRCLAQYCLPVVDAAADAMLGATTPRGWTPADLHHYLGEPSWSQSAARRRPLVAVVGWYHFGWVTDDLATYRRTFRLPPCGKGDGCLQVLRASADDEVQEEGLTTALGALHAVTPRTAGSRYRGSPGGEQVQMLQGVSAVCPECRLALVVADSDSVPDLAEAFRLAQTVRPDVVVTNLGVVPTPDRSITTLEDPSLYDGALVINAAGVGGFTAGGGEIPRRLPNVVTVGGTVVEHGRVVADSKNSSFCNSTVAQPPWQRASDTGCAGRAGVDLVLPAGQETGLAVYISGGLPGGRGWYHPGHGTQAVSIFGGLLARHNLAPEIQGPADLYAHPEWFADITAGSTDCAQWGCATDSSAPGQPCPPSARQLCDARRGWDGATGLGEPRHLPWR